MRCSLHNVLLTKVPVLLSKGHEDTSCSLRLVNKSINNSNDLLIKLHENGTQTYATDRKTNQLSWVMLNVKIQNKGRYSSSRCNTENV